MRPSLLKKVKATPICMDQFKLLFSTCRIPGPKQDKSRVNISSKMKHIVLLYRNGTYVVEVYNKNGSRKSLNEIER